MSKDDRAGAGTGGFTLLELMVVMVVLGILAGIVTFALGAFRSDARNSACRTDVRTLRTANAAYVARNGTNAHDIAALISGGYIESAPESGVTFADGVTNPASMDGCTGELAFTPDPPSSVPSGPMLSVIVSGETVHPGAENTPEFTATVTVTVTDENHVVVEGAVVTGTWDDASTPGGCTTLVSGACTFSSPHSSPNPNEEKTWTLSSVTKSGYAQAPGAVTLQCSRHNNEGGTQVCT